MQAIAYIKNRTYSSVIKDIPYKLVTGTTSNISYIRILGSLAYSLVPKGTRKNKFSDKTNKGILVGFESSNNFLKYIPSKKQVFSTRDIIIKEDLIYKDEYKLEEDYTSLLEYESPDFYYLKPYSTENSRTIEDISKESRTIVRNPENRDSSELEDFNYNSEQSSNRLIKSSKNSSNRPVNTIEDDSEDELSILPPRYGTRSKKAITSSESDIDELQLQNSRSSSRLQGSKPKNTGLSIYNIAATAYIGTLIGDDYKALNTESSLLNIESDSDSIKSSNNSGQVIITKPDYNITEPKSYLEAVNSAESSYWQKAMQKELDKLKSNNTWDLVNKESSERPIHALKTRWVYKIKESLSSNKIEFKARFVAKGFK